jgi:hypothetical protein
VLLLVTGCAARHHSAPARLSQPSPGCPTAPSPSTRPDSRAAAPRCLAIATAGNRRPDIDFDRLNGPDHERLAAARADLRDAAATERLFDR